MARLSEAEGEEKAVDGRNGGEGGTTVVDLLDVCETESFGRAAFAKEDVAAGTLVLMEVPLLVAGLESPRLVPHTDVLATASLVNISSPLWPQSIITQNFGILDAFVAADEAVQREVLAMQYEVDPSSPILESVRNCARELEKLCLFEGLDAETMSKLLLISRVNAYGFGKEQQVLLRTGRIIAHSCQANTAFVAVICQDGVCGAFRALRDIQKGEQVTSCYAALDAMAMERAQRRHYLLCQKGFRCLCAMCTEDAETEDVFDCLPCPACRPRAQDGDLSEEHLAGCCALRAVKRSPPWRSACGRTHTDNEMRIEGDAALKSEVVRRVLAPTAADAAATAAQRNLFLSQVIRRFGEDHFTSQLLLRQGAFRAVANVQALATTAERLARCHDFLVRAGCPHGVMPMHGLFKAVIARAQAEAKARSAYPECWARLVGAAAQCAISLEGGNSETSKKGAVCVKLFPKASGPSTESPS